MSEMDKRRRRWVAVVLVVLLIAAIPVGLALTRVLAPDTDPVGASDVVYVLGPPRPDRVRAGEDIMRRGGAATLLISVSPRDVQTRSVAPCDEPRPYEVICFVPDPMTTRGEGAHLARLARERGWRSAQVITYPPHVERARLLIGRCYDGQLTFPGIDDPSGWYDVLYHTAAWSKVYLDQEC